VNNLQKAALIGIALSLLLLAACGGGAYYASVTYGPPAPLVEGPIGVAPGPGYIWTPGFYVWEGNTWVWRHGEWRRPPHPDVDRWVAPHYEREGDRYRYHPGGWEHGGRFHH